MCVHRTLEKTGDRLELRMSAHLEFGCVWGLVVLEGMTVGRWGLGCPVDCHGFVFVFAWCGRGERWRWTQAARHQCWGPWYKLEWHAIVVDHLWRCAYSAVVEALLVCTTHFPARHLLMIAGMDKDNDCWAALVGCQIFTSYCKSRVIRERAWKSKGKGIRYQNVFLITQN